MTHWKTPLFALALATLLSAPALAEDVPASAGGPGKALDAPAFNKGDGGPGKALEAPPFTEDDFLGEGQLGKIEKMTEEERKAFWVQRREKWQSMSPEQREEFKKKRQAWFEALPQERKDAIKGHHDKMQGERKARLKAKWDSMTPEEQQAFRAKQQERFSKLPPEQQAKIRERGKEMRGKNGGEAPADVEDEDDGFMGGFFGKMFGGGKQDGQGHDAGERGWENGAPANGNGMEHKSMGGGEGRGKPAR